MARRRALCGVDRTIVEPDATPVFGGDDECVVIEATNREVPFADRFLSQIELRKLDRALDLRARGKRRELCVIDRCTVCDDRR